ncbi:DeoR/GlpR family DNA-binding transcription regulator [Aerococcus urinae]|uniref:DeoR/GlpR family DNA-binding transcription regulator n=1 Tax=Aerococcus TaxID=1375 RepID=UPI0018A6EAD2|nr:MULTISPECIES: DeoR/GlpR family DNA-binding transcription regulator [Aerococcus]MCY3036194.1 DeoR/GlpR family DNA-binding transcription regulator [Aerococcus sp. Group 2]MDK6520208.1 DeoR/GlpR family DNA-binding transcription regulator [Aerococcus urinae]
MDKLERLDKITEYINQLERVSTHDIAKKYDITEQTVRSDLNILENQGKIIRVHGGAKSLAVPDSFADRMTSNREEKKEIGKYAAKLINNNDILFLDGGTSHLYLVDYLPFDKYITVITASLPIALKCSRLKNVHLFLLGGDFDQRTQQFYGPRTIADIEKMNINKAFIGVSSFQLARGFFEDNTLTLAVKQKVIEQAGQVIILADSKKEEKMGIQKAFDKKDVDILITGKKDRKNSSNLTDLPFKMIEI